MRLGVESWQDYGKPLLIPFFGAHDGCEFPFASAWTPRLARSSVEDIAGFIDGDQHRDGSLWNRIVAAVLDDLSHGFMIPRSEVLA